MQKTENISASMEDYLEAIYQGIANKGAVKSKDIAKSLKVKAGSVTGALQNLQKSGFINYAPYELVTLTDSGLARARSVARKHNVLKEFFADILGIEQELADQAACRVEHSVGDEIIDRLIYFTEMIQADSIDLVGKFKESFNEQVA